MELAAKQQKKLKLFALEQCSKKTQELGVEETPKIFEECGGDPSNTLAF